MDEMGTEQGGQSLCSSLAVHLYAEKDVKPVEYTITGLCDRGLELPLLNGGQY